MSYIVGAKTRTDRFNSGGILTSFHLTPVIGSRDAEILSVPKNFSILRHTHTNR